jgi:hypothetical protein
VAGFDAEFVVTATHVLKERVTATGSDGIVRWRVRRAPSGGAESWTEIVYLQQDDLTCDDTCEVGPPS